MWAIGDISELIVHVAASHRAFLGICPLKFCQCLTKFVLTAIALLEICPDNIYALLQLNIELGLGYIGIKH